MRKRSVRGVIRAAGRQAARFAVITFALVVGLGAGVAFAYFKSGQGTGSGTATTGSVATISASGASLSGSLYPGASVNLVVTVKNPYSNMGMAVTGLAAGTGSISVSGGTGCTTSNSGVSLNTGATFSPTTITAGGQAQITFSGAVQMSSTTNFSGCQGATFTVPAAVKVKVG
jgi:hypothetical protein